jgi:phosphoribosylaminoimidazolecarboxamide formyltransferase/IMP cyclohydrolase
VHGGLLARRDVPEHMAALKEHGIQTIDLLIVNLYPFEATVAKPGCTLEDAIENIDIGGPAMVRSAAKNWKDVAVLTDASQYATVISELSDLGKVSEKTRFALSVAAFHQQLRRCHQRLFVFLQFGRRHTQRVPSAIQWPFCEIARLALR